MMKCYTKDDFLESIIFSLKVKVNELLLYKQVTADENTTKECDEVHPIEGVRQCSQALSGTIEKMLSF